GFTYFGPFDGHNIPELLRVLSLAKQIKGPVLVHIYTTKGKGFAPAELDPVGYHAISKLPVEIKNDTQAVATEKSLSNTKPALKYSQVFGQFLCDKATADDKLLAVTPAMEEGSGMIDFARQFPERFFDVAIAERHAVTLAAGMATQGVKPIVAIYSTFLQRGYDQLIHDVALQNLDVMFAIDRAGLVGED
uniref:1-deoxy-D-xylulose-5-phosphate synthase N-terminal domain-containing protein n=1 Tax=Psychrobacter sanguinis TaxID=861445 RepID=UPI002A0A2940